MLSKYILFVNNLLQKGLYNENVYKMRLLYFFCFQLTPHISCNYKKADESKERIEPISVTFVAATDIGSILSLVSDFEWIT